MLQEQLQCSQDLFSPDNAKGHQLTNKHGNVDQYIIPVGVILHCCNGNVNKHEKLKDISMFSKDTAKNKCFFSSIYLHTLNFTPKNGKYCNSDC